METEESEDGAGGNDNRNVEGILNLKEEKKLKNYRIDFINAIIVGVNRGSMIDLR